MKSKVEAEADLDEALRETFPGSDPIAIKTDTRPTRPIDRLPPKIPVTAIGNLACDNKLTEAVAILTELRHQLTHCRHGKLDACQTLNAMSGILEGERTSDLLRIIEEQKL